MSGGAWDAMLQLEADTCAIIRSVPGIPPRDVEVPAAISSQAGLAALRDGARLGG